MSYTIRVEGEFQASHFIPRHAGKCRNLHGHSYRVEVFLKSEKLDENGISTDFGEVSTFLRTLLGEFDHKHLNDLPAFVGITTSAENIADKIWERLITIFPELIRVRVWEGPSVYVEVDEN